MIESTTWQLAMPSGRERLPHHKVGGGSVSANAYVAPTAAPNRLIDSRFFSLNVFRLRLCVLEMRKLTGGGNRKDTPYINGMRLYNIVSNSVIKASLQILRLNRFNLRYHSVSAMCAWGDARWHSIT